MNAETRESLGKQTDLETDELTGTSGQPKRGMPEDEEEQTLAYFRSLPGDEFYLKHRQEFIRRMGFDAFEARIIHKILTPKQLEEYRALLPCAQCGQPGGQCDCHKNPRIWRRYTR